jgi:glycosyltransferase involved in cell wall biosynthesis
MIKEPLISIITPTFNSVTTIEDCLKSATYQSYKNFEHLIIDGLSSDATLDIIKKYQTQYSYIRFISEKDMGIYDAMNKGINMAKGEWLYFLGSDDILYDENVFSALVPLFNNLKLKIIYGNIITKISGKEYDGKFNSLKLLNRNICHQSIFSHKSVFDKLGGFEIKYKSLADWHFNMRWFNDKQIKHKYIDLLIACYNENGYGPNNPDLRFFQDWDYNINKYFPKISRKLYKYKNRMIVGKMLKVLWDV